MQLITATCSELNSRLNSEVFWFHLRYSPTANLTNNYLICKKLQISFLVENCISWIFLYFMFHRGWIPREAAWNYLQHIWLALEFVHIICLSWCEAEAMKKKRQMKGIKKELLWLWYSSFNSIHWETKCYENKTHRVHKICPHLASTFYTAASINIQ